MKQIIRHSITYSKIKRRFLKHIWLARISILSLFILIFSLVFFLAVLVIKETPVGSFLTGSRYFIFPQKSKIASFDGRTNLVILGKSGEGHIAGDLTDTIMFISISHGASIVLISLPRDIWIPALRTKLNSVYYWGNQKEKGGGLVLVKSTVEEIIGQPVHYGVVVDFSGFTQIIDTLGGIEVNVESGFIDEKYPIAGLEADLCNGDREFRCRYETLRFLNGTQLMDGATALKFVRSRNAKGDEGTDLARAARQQKVLVAIENKILDKSTLFAPKKIQAIYEIINSSIETDIDNPARIILARRLFDARKKLNSYVLSDELLFNPPISPKYDNQYVFIPKKEDWNDVHNWVKSKLKR